jgi:uncharacterized BrkB/YihY/UPF0761 family membrane protein
MHLQSAYRIMKSALWDFVDDDAMTLGAALTFYATLSLAPLVLILPAITALLFTLGKSLLGLYLGRSTVASPYGSAGSLVVILLWVYYASLIFFFGAEITQTYVRFQGRPLQPDEDAERIPAAEKGELQEAASGRG